MAVILYLLLLAAAVYAISKSSDELIDVASTLGRQLHLKDYFIGSLIVGVGTSLPELMTSIAAVGEEAPELVAPTVFGTIIANIGAGLGLAAIGLYCFVRTKDGKLQLFSLARPYAGGAIQLGADNAESDSLGTPLFFAVFSTLLAALLCMDGVFSRADAILFIVGYLAFIANEVLRRSSPSSSTPIPADVVQAAGKGASAATRRSLLVRIPFTDAARIIGSPLAVVLLFAVFWQATPIESASTKALFLLSLVGVLVFQITLFVAWKRHPSSVPFPRFVATVLRNQSKLVLTLLMGINLAVVFLSGSVIVKTVLVLAEELGIDSGVLAASAIAVGTSLPDIVVATKVVRRGRHMLLIGHILQSNIFDVFLIMGSCGLFVSLPVGDATTQKTLIFAAALTFALLPAFRSRRIKLPEGVLLFLAFLAFLIALF